MKWETQDTIAEAKRKLVSIRKDSFNIEEELSQKGVGYIKEFIKKNQLLQNDLVEMLEIDKGNLSKILNSKQKVSLNKIFKILNKIRTKDAETHDFLLALENILKVKG